jgi:hypothetical protein
LHSSPSIIRLIKSRKITCVGHVAGIGEKRKQYRLLEGKRPLVRPRRKWLDNIKMDLGGRGWCGVGWTDLAQGRHKWRALVNTVMNLSVP